MRGVTPYWNKGRMWKIAPYILPSLASLALHLAPPLLGSPAISPHTQPSSNQSRPAPKKKECPSLSTDIC